MPHLRNASPEEQPNAAHEVGILARVTTFRGFIHAIEGFAALSALAGAPERALVLGGAMSVFRKKVKAVARQREEALLQLDDAIRIALEETA